MKNIFWFVCLFLYAVPVSLTAQSEEAIPILAVRLTEEAAEPYLEEYQLTGVTVDEEAILRPAAGYDMYFLPEKEQFVVKPVKIPIQSTDDYEAKDVPGGTMFCMCGAANDDCEISVTIENGTISYFCDGSCGCGSFIIFDVSFDTPEFQSASGDWRSFGKK